MLVVHKFVPAWGLSDVSPFVTKLETWLRMAAIPYGTATGVPFRAPKGKLPYVDDDGERLGDSSFIIERLAQKHGVTLDAHLNDAERAIATAFRSMVEEHLLFVILHQRWQRDEGWAVLRPVMLEFAAAAKIPSLVRGVVMRRVRSQQVRALRGQGTGRHSSAEVDAIGVRLVDALAAQLGDRRYFLGDRPSSIDATVWSFTMHVVTPPIPSATRERVGEKGNLVAYCERMKKEHWT